NRRRTFSYSDADAPESEVWVVRSDDQRQAREILRDAGLIDSTRPVDGYITPTFRSYTAELTQAASPARRKLFRIKLGLLVLIAAVVVAAGMHTLNQPPVQAVTAPVEVQIASPPFDGSIAA